MKDLQLKISKWNDSLKSYYIEDYCKSIKLSNSFTQIAAELSCEIPYATFSQSLLAIKIEMGDKVTLVYNGIQLFAGKVIDANEKGKAQTLNLICYDYCWWVCKSNITKNFNNISVRSALEYVYQYIGATYDIDYELGSNGGIMIKSHLVKKKPASKVLYAIYNEVTKAKQGVYYYMHTQGDGATITITEADKYYSGLTIQSPTSLNSADGNLIDYEINESMQNMITMVDFFKTTGEIYDESKTLQLPQNDMNRFGVIIENIEVADDDTNAIKALAEGNKKLSEQGKPSEELTVICYGSIRYQVAYGVMVKIPDTNYFDRFMYIVSSEWTWSKQSMFDDKFSFISKLGLSPSKNKNLEDWTSIEEKQDDSNSTKSSDGSSDLVNRIIAELKKYLGLAYKWGGKSPADGGMDCSGYIAYVYNQFKNELEINGGELVSYTYTMMKQGDDVTSDFPNNLKECDIIFPSDHHVVAYIGNGQIIEEPQTGDVCKIGPIRWDNVVKVIRVVPDSAWKTSSSKDSSSNGKYSSKLVEFTKSWEGFKDIVYDDGRGTSTIGYGTTAAANAGAISKGNCTEEEATKWLQDEMNDIANQVQKALDNRGATLNQSWFDCLCDLSYQWGWPTIITNNKKNIFGSLCDGDKDSAKASIKTLGYARRDNARCDMLDGNYNLNS